jgi:hypothetical protein
MEISGLLHESPVQAWKADPERGCTRSLKQTLKPILLVMKITGLYHGNGGVQISNGTEPKPHVIIGAKIQLIYFTVLLILQWFNVVRLLLSFWLGNPASGSTVFRIIMTIWMFQCASSATILFRACRNPWHISAFLRQI